jgi:hypothetical protein
MAEKKIGPREQQLRTMRALEAEHNKQLIDRAARKMKMKAIGKVVSIKVGKRGGRGR